MALVRRSSTTFGAVVVDVGRAGRALTRHDLPGGVAISFVFDGDPDRPRTCQWRVAAAEESELRSAVSGLLAELARAGVEVERPRCSGGVCHFQDFGPWPDCP